MEPLKALYEANRGVRFRAARFRRERKRSATCNFSETACRPVRAQSDSEIWSYSRENNSG